MQARNPCELFCLQKAWHAQFLRSSSQTAFASGCLSSFLTRVRGSNGSRYPPLIVLQRLSSAANITSRI